MEKNRLDVGMSGRGSILTLDHDEGEDSVFVEIYSGVYGIGVSAELSIQDRLDLIEWLKGTLP